MRSILFPWGGYLNLNYNLTFLINLAQKTFKSMIEYMANETNRTINSSRHEIAVLRKRSIALFNFARRISKRTRNGDSFTDELEQLDRIER